ncbi:hypothetical protein KKG45_02970 [bacterium]|nr:hypothetical protein [bacterium]MBU1072186.1 hypothetical protein [bacterium]MBU1675835.1 hypothetical protein [bacterium]
MFNIRHARGDHHRGSVWLLCVILAVLTPPGSSFGDPYVHTIVIDGTNDFNSGDIFTSTSGSYTAYLTWDATHFYIGCEGPDVGANDPQRRLLVYIDPGPGPGAASGLIYNTQSPSFSDILPKYHFAWQTSGASQFWEWTGSSWSTTTDPSSFAVSGNFVELSLPLGAVDDPTTFGLAMFMINEASLFEWTYAGMPDDAFTDGYDPDVITHFAGNLSSSLPPNQSGILGTVVIDAEPDTPAFPWQMTGPDSYLATGAGDSTLIDLAPGSYTATWLAAAGWQAPEPETQTLVEGGVLTFVGSYGAVPSFTSIADIPGDQGGRVRLVWNRVAHDDPLDPVVVTAYEVYRRDDTGLESPGSGFADKLAGWDWVDSVPAHGDPVYQFVAPTLCDSTITWGMCWSVFLLRAVTADPYLFYASAPDSGYAVDNLPPNAPSGFAVAYGNGNDLSWEPSIDTDFRYFKVYRGTTPGFEIDPEHPLHTTIDEAWTDATGTYDHHYLITAVDSAGNESPLAAPATMTGAGGGSTPPTTRLRQNVPNPFNPATTIAFDLARETRVELAVYDLSGGLVRRLMDGETLDAGTRSLLWDGRDDAGRLVTTGIYLLRLMAGERSDSRRIALIR